MPKYSICVPSYNRARFLEPLLDSVLAQDFRDFDVIIAEDGSPERERIRRIALAYRDKHGPERIRYHENERNLGYDGNIRNLIRLADSEYCFFLGNDDLMAPGGLGILDRELSRHARVGVVIRSYSWFNDRGVEHVVRYHPGHRLYPAGEDAIVFAYRRAGVISGYVVRTEPARRLDTDRYDGTLFYQMHLTLNVLKEMDALYLDDTTVLCRNEIPPDFGHAAAEQGCFTPGAFTPASRLRMTGNILEIARRECGGGGGRLYDRIVDDMAKYSFSILAKERACGLANHIRSYRLLAGMGLARKVHFHLYFLLLAVLGAGNSNRLIFGIKDRLGYTPRL